MTMTLVNAPELVIKRPTLRPLQIEAVKKMLHFLMTNPERGCYNASVRGVGKSAMSLGVVNELKPKSTLIICPAIAVLNWKDEILKWVNYECPVSIWTIKSSKEVKRNSSLSDFTIISYGLTRNSKVLAWLKRQQIDLLILDEVHSNGIKNTKSKTKKAVLNEVWPICKYRICLSGTPFTQGVIDCYTVFSRLNPTAFKDYYSFANTYTYVEKTPWGDCYYGLRNAEKLKRIIRGSFFLRYTKEEMAAEIPAIQWSKITLGSEYAVKITEEERKENELYIKLLEEAIGEGKAIPQPPVNFQTKRKRQGLRKLPFTIEFVRELVESNEPTIVGFIFLECLHAFVKAMKEFKPSVIYGAVGQDDRYTEIKRFQDGETSLLIGQIHSMNTCINLQRAENVVLAEPDYSPAVIDQFIGRADRMGRNTAVNAYYLITENTIEEDAVRIVLSKNKIFKKVLCN